MAWIQTGKAPVVAGEWVCGTDSGPSNHRGLQSSESHLHRRGEHDDHPWRAALGGVVCGHDTGAKIETCPNAYVVVSTSSDGGKTWKEVLALDPDGSGKLKAVDPRPWVDPKGRLWIIFHITTNGISHIFQNKKSWAITADDAEKENPSWSRPRHIADGVMINKPVVLASGDWLFAAHDRKSVETGLLKAVVSEDNGQTFKCAARSKPATTCMPSSPWRSSARTARSRWMLIRTGNAGDLDTRQAIAESFSTDRRRDLESAEDLRDQQHGLRRFHISRLQSRKPVAGEALADGCRSRNRRQETAAPVDGVYFTR